MEQKIELQLNRTKNGVTTEQMNGTENGVAAERNGKMAIFYGVVAF